MQKELSYKTDPGMCTFEKDTVMYFFLLLLTYSLSVSECFTCKNVQAGKDQEKAQSERDSHSKNRGGKKPN